MDVQVTQTGSVDCQGSALKSLIGWKRSRWRRQLAESRYARMPEPHLWRGPGWRCGRRLTRKRSWQLTNGLGHAPAMSSNTTVELRSSRAAQPQVRFCASVSRIDYKSNAHNVSLAKDGARWTQPGAGHRLPRQRPLPPRNAFSGKDLQPFRPHRDD